MGTSFTTYMLVRSKPRLLRKIFLVLWIHLRNRRMLSRSPNPDEFFCRFGLHRLILALGALILAAEPLLWLARSWSQPGFPSPGLAVFVLAAGLFLYSLSSPVRREDSRGKNAAWAVFLFTALVRLAGRLLGVNLIGAMALVLDVYALGLMAGLPNRRRPVSPVWVAAIFFFSLPLEKALLRTVGFGLQQASAFLAGGALKMLFDGVACHGVRILLNGKDILVDLPCSGARGLLHLLLLFSFFAAVKRPKWPMAALGFLLALGGALHANTWRIVLLALGLAFPGYAGNIQVMSQPAHDLIGLATLALGAIPLVTWARKVRPRTPASLFFQAPPPRAFSRKTRFAMAAAFLAVSLAIVLTPRLAFDASAPRPAPILPAMLGDYAGTPVPLEGMESVYLAQYGGGAAKADYQGRRLMVVCTKAPLRHLHSPEECLEGAGAKVRLVGADLRGAPSAVYESVSPDGVKSRIAVTFVNEQGQMAASVSEAVWKWWQDTDSAWTMIQRIYAWDLPEWEMADFEKAVARAFDLRQPEQEEKKTHGIKA